MNHWVCSCGKKVAETMKACPYCKALKQQELKVVSTDAKYLKMIIALLGFIIAGGVIYLSSMGSKPSEPPKQYHVVNASEQAQPQKTSVQIPQSAILAYKALKKVEARTEVGVSRRDYPEVIAEAKVAVNLFLESPESKGVPDLTQSLEKAMKHYADAKNLWDVNNEYPGLNADFRDYWLYAAEELKKASAMIGNIPQ
ncbi:hypothetical protein EG832_03435 [bacterium]|nr:hypothetical protein [bacterium]